MRKRDIILDFTSLLDVTLIVIFFFVIFSNLDAADSQAQLDRKVSALETAISAAQEREDTADAVIARLEQEIETVRSADARSAENLEEMLAYGKSGNIKLILVRKDSQWIVRMNHRSAVVCELPITQTLGTELTAAFETAAYTREDTIFCDFIFDGAQPGTAQAYRGVISSLSTVRKAYPFLYCSETDLSIGGEEP